VIGDAIAGAFHTAPREMIRGDLRRFRELLEAAGPAVAPEAPAEPNPASA
jgi:hypothetical protein